MFERCWGAVKAGAVKTASPTARLHIYQEKKICHWEAASCPLAVTVTILPRFPSGRETIGIYLRNMGNR